MRLRAHTFARLTVPAALLAVTLGCNKGDDDASTNRGGGAKDGRATASADNPRIASIPNDPCTWITAAEVEAVVGKLTEPPRRYGNGCRYPIPLDSATRANKEFRREGARKLLGPDAPLLRDTLWDRNAVIVEVDVSVDGSHARASRELLEGWDDVSRGFGSFNGRIGHVRVIVSEQDVMERTVPFEKKAAIATLVRDRIPDLPFGNPNGDVSSFVAPNENPCSLFERSEVEAIIGPLGVDPYRIGETEPLAEKSGRSCGYFTKSHRVLVVTPFWTDGKSEVKMERGFGKLIGIVASNPEGEAADTLEGPWEQAVTGLDGSLLFLTGDRLLRISHATSSIDVVNALKLARIGVARLASASPR